jgi:glycosyltransferase involved in cell wall biosynthesis
MTAVDIIIPCYNYGRYLEYCVNSVLSQTGVELRVLIIDDMSTDNTSLVGLGLAQRDSRITFRRHDVNIGLVRTANKGVLEWASAEFSLLLSADDALAPGSLMRALRLFQGNPHIGMVYGMARLITTNESVNEAPCPDRLTCKIIDGPCFLKISCLEGNPVASPTAVVRTEMLKRTGGYCERFPHTSDMEMWMRLATMSSIGVIKSIQAYYRIHDHNMSKEFTSGWLTDLQERFDTCEYIYMRWSEPAIEGFDRWLATMKRIFADRALRAASTALSHGDWRGYEDCLAFAHRMNPYCFASEAALRVGLKRIMGASLARSVGALVRRLPGGGVPQERSKIAPEWRPGSTFGWWPASDE